MLDFEWYRSFVAVYRIGTVSGAAETRFLTQPAVSQHLAALEAAVGEALFRRTPRHMEPTERGKELYSHIAQAVDNLEQAARQMREQKGGTPSLLRLGSAAEYFRHRVAVRLAAAPFRLRVQFGLAQTLIELLTQRELDIVIAAQRLPAPALDYEKLTEETFLLVGTASIATLAPAQQDLTTVEAWLLGQSWISYGAELPIIRRFWQQSFNHRPDISPHMVIPDLDGIAEAVKQGAGISLLPDYMCEAAIARGELAVLWTPRQPIVNELWLAYRRSDRDLPMIQQMRQLLLPVNKLALRHSRLSAKRPNPRPHPAIRESTPLAPLCGHESWLPAYQIALA